MTVGRVERLAETNDPAADIEDEEYANRHPGNSVIEALELDDDEEDLEEYDTAQHANHDGTRATSLTNLTTPQRKSTVLAV